MPEKDTEVLNILGALLVSTISGIASITRRLSQGVPINLFWVTSEFLTAILCGYLMFTAYPSIVGSVPDWFTLPIAVAVSAHLGGRIFQDLEKEIITRLQKLLKA